MSDRLQTNHLGTTLLAILLLPYMMKAVPTGPFPRLTIVTSDLHFMANLSEESKQDRILETINDEKHCTPSVMRERYSLTKRLSSRTVSPCFPTTNAYS